MSKYYIGSAIYAFINCVDQIIILCYIYGHTFLYLSHLLMISFVLTNLDRGHWFLLLNLTAEAKFAFKYAELFQFGEETCSVC